MASRKEQKAAARERMRQEMERRKRRTRRNRLIGITAGAVVLVVAVAAIGIVVQQQRADQRARTPTKIAKDGLSVPVGKAKAPVTLTVYEDFRCPGCKGFESKYGATIDKLVDAGKLRVEYRLVTIIDTMQRGRGSKVAGNAAVCANEVGKFRPYHKLLYENQPPERQDSFTTEKVLDLAKKVKGLGDDSTFKKCVQNNHYRKWLPKVQGEMDKRFGRPGTPSLLLDDKVALGGEQKNPIPEVASPAALKQTVEERAKKRSNQGASGSGD